MADQEKWVTVAKREDVEPGEVIGATVGEEQIAIYNLDGEFRATGNICTHAYAILSDGWVDGDVIECPLHGGRFDIRTGKALGPPVERDIKVYEVRLSGEEVQVRVGD